MLNPNGERQRQRRYIQRRFRGSEENRQGGTGSEKDYGCSAPLGQEDSGSWMRGPQSQLLGSHNRQMDSYKLYSYQTSANCYKKLDYENGITNRIRLCRIRIRL